MAKRTPRMGTVTPTKHPVPFPESVKTGPGGTRFVLELGEFVEVDLDDLWVVKQMQRRGAVGPDLTEAKSSKRPATKAAVKKAEG